MKKNYFLLLTVISLITVNAQNELTNGSFETWTSGAPNDWNGSKTSIATSGISEYTAEAYEGTSALALLSTSASHKRFTNVAITAANEEYTLKYYAKGEGEIRNAYHDGSYSSYTGYTTFNGTEDWTLIEYVFTPAAGPLEVIFSVRNGAGDGILIDDVVLVKSSTLSTNKVEKETVTYSIFPNPTTTGFVNIKSATTGAITVSVFDVLGKQVIYTSVNNNRLNVSSLNAGVYIMQLNKNGTLTTKKLVIK